MKTKMLLTEIPQPFKRISFKKDWDKAKRNPNSMVEVCNHENKKPWDCGCSWGCDMCNITHRCEDCGGCLGHDAIPHAKLIKTA